jgi:hypothetical protein
MRRAVLLGIILAGCRSAETVSSSQSAEAPLADTAPAPQPALAPPTCIFGDELADVTAGPDFKRVERGNVKRAARVGDLGAREFAVTELRRVNAGDRVDGTRFTLFLADGDENRGAFGWIEQEGKIVAEIRDGDVASCLVTEAKAAQVAEDCLFGDDLAGILGLGEFSVKTEADAERASPLPADKGGKRQVFVRTLAHVKTQKTFKLFAVKDDDHLTTEATGWIEDAGGAAVALFGIGEVYQCAVAQDGQPRVALAPAPTDEIDETVDAGN